MFEDKEFNLKNLLETRDDELVTQTLGASVAMVTRRSERELSLKSFALSFEYCNSAEFVKNRRIHWQLKV